MFNKLVVLKILCFKKPCNITILDYFGKTLQKFTIKSTSSKICVCTRSCLIKLIAKHNGLTYFKTIHLNNCKCQNVFLSFAFNTTFLQKTINVFMLNDANYGMPVNMALLNFRHLNLLQK